MIDPRIDKAEFADVIRVAAGRMDTPNPSILAILEKDYWVTRVLCAAAEAFPDDVLLKGGTSLSKAFGLTRRFSEDVDLVVKVVDLGEARRDKLLKSIAETVRDKSGLRIGSVRSDRGVHRDVTYLYEPIWSGSAAIASGVLLEMGTRSGVTPAEPREVRTLIAEFVPDAAPELPQATVSTLSLRRTLVEKLFVVHAAVAAFDESDSESNPGRLGRHYYDIGALLGDADVRDSVGTEEFWEIAADVDARGTRNFPKTHRAPERLDFTSSLALFPDAATRRLVDSAYDRDRPLFLGDIPLLQKTLDTLEDLRPVLKRVADASN